MSGWDDDDGFYEALALEAELEAERRDAEELAITQALEEQEAADEAAARRNR